ncbi:MAG: phosphatase PAP2 family protein [Prevotellaceae bacterium]|jgi:undecaprenyl-diphosphatase|nr:phosphatase PAP2 family protein [Prevotellaceae bacterium]
MGALIENIIALDKEWFCRLGIEHTAFLDSFMMRFTTTEVWLPFFALIIYVLVKNAKRDSVYIIVALLLVVLLADQISSSILKPLTERLRPSHNPAMEACVQLVNGYRGGHYGFVSSHAANTMGIALFTSLLFRYAPYTLCVFAWALVNCYTRIYLGVHYPLDLLGGAVVGFLSAGTVYFVWKRKQQSPVPYVERKDLQILSTAILVTTVLIALL